MEIFYIILALLILARIFAEVAEALGQPALIGELFAGIFFGMFVHHFGHHLGLTLDFAHEENFTLITDLGIFFLMLLAGLELSPREMQSSSKLASFIALGGLLLPLGLGIGLGLIFIPESAYRTPQILFIGTAMAITAVPVAVRVLMDVGKLDTKLGHRIVSAAVMDDILSLMLLAVLTGMIESGEVPSMAALGILVAKVLLFFILCWGLGKYILPIFGKMLRRSHVEEGGFGGLLIMGFAFAIIAELLGLHFIIGAFFAGLLFRDIHVGKGMYKIIETRVSGVTSGFLAPLFFASIGLHITLGALIEIPLFTVSLIVLAIIGKVIGAGLPNYLQEKNMRESAIIGSAMNGRGAVELIIVDIALRAGLFDHPSPQPPVIEHMFSAIVIMAIVTTIMTPVLLKMLMKTDSKGE